MGNFETAFTMQMPGFQDQIAIDDQRERQARPVSQGGLNIHASVDQAVSHHGKG
ncbi:hypothetical protein SXCC_04240 [Gluconacetobacter sp. SXCC-1]|nr:hypothetical protein SXCC_04240 [Gluconacetobacter sp. SXCC-1]